MRSSPDLPRRAPVARRGRGAPAWARLALVVAGVAGLGGCPRSDRRPDPTGAPPPTKANPVSLEIPPLPPGDAVPAAADLARLLAGGVPAPQRAAAIALLEQRILPWDLRSRSTHPFPRRLTELVYAGLADPLRAVAADARLAALEELACDRSAGRLLEDAVAHAVARYVRDRKPPTRPGLDGYLAPAQPLLALTSAQALAAIDATAAAWDGWDTEASRFPRCAAAHRLDRLHARAALGNARTGSFASAAGPLHAFLVQAGESPQLVDVH